MNRESLETHVDPGILNEQREVSGQWDRSILWVFKESSVRGLVNLPRKLCFEHSLFTVKEGPKRGKHLE